MTDFNKLKLIPFKYKYNESKNKVYTYIKDWETGCYDEQGNKDEDVTKIRIPELISISGNNRSYYFNTYSDDFKFTIVTFDENKDFVRYIGVVENDSVIEFQQDEKYYGLSITGTSNLENKNVSTENSDDLLTEIDYLIEIEQNLDFIRYEYLFKNGIIKPTVYYSNEQDKTFSEFKEIPIEDYKLNARRTKSWEVKEKYRVSKVTYYDATRVYSYGTNGGNTLYIRQDNPFIKDENTIYNIYNAVRDTEYYSLTNECYGNILANAGDCILYELGDKKYYTLYNGELTYQINVMEKNSVSIPSLQQEQTTNVLNKDVATNQKTIKTEIDLINASMKLQASQITQVSNEVSNVSSNLNDNYYNKDETDAINETINSNINHVQEIQNSLEVSLDGIKLSLNNTANKVNNMNYNFTTDALTILSKDQENNSKLDNNGLRVYNYEELIAIYNSNGSGVDKLIVTGTAQIGYFKTMKRTINRKGRERKVTSEFYLEELIEELVDLEVK